MRTVFSPLRASAAAALLLVLTYCGGDDVAAPTTGSLTVTAGTSGATEPVPDYSVMIDSDPGLALPANGSVTVGDLTEGVHVVRLVGTPAACSVSGDNPRSVAVAANQTASTSFEISCPLPGSVEVTTSTTGDALDTDGYLASVDEGAGVPVPINGVTTISGVAAGNHRFRLTGIAANCDLQQDNPSAVTVQSGATISLSFQVTCRTLEPAEGVILFQSDRASSSAGHHVFRMKDDGSNVTDLTPESDGEDGVIAPGGTRIAFTSYRSGNRDIYLMDPDGSHVTRITQDPEDDFQPAWSPDESKIAFASNRSQATEIWVMNADGTGATQITRGGGFQPSWSPDGKNIAFSRAVRFCMFDVCSVHIFVATANGGSVTDISGTGDKFDYNPAWSPQGTKIAFEEDRKIWSMEANGSGRVQLTQGTRGDYAPVWAPDGSKIAFEQVLSTQQIFVMNADGSNPTNLSNNSENDVPTSWR